MKLFPYQVEGVAWLAQRKTALLADEMGLGKTAQAICAAKGDTVVVCPASVQEVWRREQKRFPNGITRLRVFSYNRIAMDGPEGVSRFDTLILDEAHYLKSVEAQRTGAILTRGGLAHRAGRQIISVTGTPAPNHPLELWPLLRTLAPETILNHSGEPFSLEEFRHKFCVVDANDRSKVRGGRNLEELKDRIAPFVLRRKKSEVLKDMPPLRVDTLPLDSSRAAEYLSQIPEEEVRLLIKLLEAGEDPGQAAEYLATLVRLTGLAKARPATDWIANFLRSSDEKIVVFARHLDVMDELCARLSLFGPLRVDGSKTMTQRTEAIDLFQSDPAHRVLIGQIQAAGTGITLTAASTVLFVEHSWVPAENEQAAMRIHRIGQRNACVAYFAMLSGSIDEKIAAVAARKARDSLALFG